MAVIQTQWFSHAFSSILGGITAGESKKCDYLSDTIKVMLCTSSYTPNQETHVTKSDVTNEVSVTGYTAGGQALSNKSFSFDTDNNIVRLLADDLSWSVTPGGLTCRYAVIYDDTDSADILLGYIDFGQNKSDSSGTFGLTFGASGVLGMRYGVPV